METEGKRDVLKAPTEARSFRKFGSMHDTTKFTEYSIQVPY